jgi:hypothetical protein
LSLSDVQCSFASFASAARRPSKSGTNNLIPRSRKIGETWGTRRSVVTVAGNLVLGGRGRTQRRCVGPRNREGAVPKWQARRCPLLPPAVGRRRMLALMEHRLLFRMIRHC